MEGIGYVRCEEHGEKVWNDDTCSYCDVKMSERRRIVGVLSLDLLLRDKKTSDEWLKRAMQLIEGGHDG